MQHRRLGGKGDRAGFGRPQAEDIVGIPSQRRVETAQALQNRSPVHHVARTVRRARPPGVDLVRKGRHLAGPSKCHALRANDLRIRHRLGQRGEPTRLRKAIVVGKSDEHAARFLDPAIARRVAAPGSRLAKDTAIRPLPIRQ
jgi:hypothetical protein